jgi:hypothetical protein
MSVNVRITAIALALLSAPAVASEHGQILWRAPHDIRTRNLLYGAGGREHAPHGPYTFVKEDLGGSNPKYSVFDRDGVKWKVKLGREARPETAATRIVWAAGYFTDEDYYLPEIRVKGVPATLHRGRQWISAEGVMQGARLEREAGKKIETWRWKKNPFLGTPEFNGLRTVMGLINNWDVKDENTAVYKEDGERIYVVSDLGATFAAPGYAFPASQAKDNLEQFEKARFLCEITRTKVDFCSPGRSALMRLATPKEFIERWRMRWIGHDVPRADAKWMGGILSQLSQRQIRDAFRAAGYSPEEVEGFARVLERRIGELTEL